MQVFGGRGGGELVEAVTTILFDGICREGQREGERLPAVLKSTFKGRRISPESGGGRRERKKRGEPEGRITLKPGENDTKEKRKCLSDFNFHLC